MERRRERENTGNYEITYPTHPEAFCWKIQSAVHADLLHLSMRWRRRRL
jgi:hypothetical protein